MKFIFILFLLASCSGSEIEVEIVESLDSRRLSSRSFGAETMPDGTGSLLKSESLITRDGSLHIYAIERDDQGNFIQNTEVEWILTGSAGTLTVQSGGKSAIYNPVSTGTSKVSFTINNVKETINLNVIHNSAPSINLTTPTGAESPILIGSNFDIQWSDNDIDDDASIDLYYSTLSSGDCSAQNLITSGVSEDSAMDNLLWDTTSLSDGTYYICAVITDPHGSEQVWNPNSIDLYTNIAPSFAFTTPAADVIVAFPNNQLITWTDSDPDDDATINFYIKTSTSGACSTGALIQTDTTNNSAESFTFNISTQASGHYYLCASVDDGHNPALNVHSPRMSLTRTCAWTGASDGDFSNSSNWMNCNSMSPQISDYIQLTGAGTDPIVTADTTIFGIAAGGSAQDIAINSGVQLTIDSEDAFLSSVTFKGSSSTCSDCDLRISDNENYVKNGSTLRFEPGISVYAARGSINVGDGVTSGHLEIAGGPSQAEWVNFKNTSAWGFYGFFIEGTAGEKATVNINNAVIEYYNGYSSHATKGIYFKDHYEILGIDNILFPSRFGDSQTSNLRLDNCSNGVFTDSDWSNLEFVNHFGSRSENIYVNDSNCTSIPVAGSITMTNASGFGYGTPFEYDPNNLITWFNESSGICTWNGSVDSDWFNPANWSGCTNGRNNYPDQFNDVFLPGGTPNSPMLSSDATINSFDTTGALGGDILTIASDARLWIASNEIRSNVSFTGATDSCVDCVLGSDTIKILNDATVTMLRGMRVRVRDSSYAFDVGDGVETGHLVINANSTNQNFWTRFQPWSYYNEGIRVRGVDALNLSSVSINGLFSPMHSGGNYTLELQQFFELKQLDNLHMESAFGWDMTRSRIYFNNCTDSLITDTSWDQLDFYSPAQDPVVNGFNVEFVNCPLLPSGLIDITQMSGGNNAGFGAAYANDPNNVLIWNP